MIGSDLVCRCLYLFTYASTRRNVCRFSLNQNRKVEVCPAYRNKVYTENVILASPLKKRQRNREKFKAFEKGKGFLWLLTGKMVISFLRDGFSNWGDSKFIPAGWKLNTFILNRFSLNPNCLVKIFPAYRIQSVHWKYHIGNFFHQKTKK